ILLTLLRVLQGIGVGGEWGGSVLMSMEWGTRKQRGLMAAWPQAGVPIGLARAVHRQHRAHRDRPLGAADRARVARVRADQDVGQGREAAAGRDAEDAVARR